MVRLIQIAQIIVAALLATAILLQQKGSGLSTVFGGEGNVYRTRRGAEKGLFISTIVLSVVFLGLALTSFLLRR